MKCPHCGKETETQRDWTTEFQLFQSFYPTRNGGQRWPEARTAFARLCNHGTDPVDLLASVQLYGPWCKASKVAGTPYVMQAATWLGRGGGYLEDWARLLLVETPFDQARRQLQETS